MRKFIFSIFFLLLWSTLSAQNSSGEFSYSGPYLQQLRQMVSFLEYSLNTIGDDSADVEDKEIIILESYSKVFRNEKVQVEDDLDEARLIPVYKNIQAYLKDVNFFFRHVQFHFRILDIANYVNESGKQYFKISMERTIDGIAMDGTPVKNTLPRFIEINLEEPENELKIAAFYTTKLNEEQELLMWWKSLSPEWKSIVGAEIPEPMRSETERLTPVLKHWVSRSRLDLSTHPEIMDISPLSRLWELRELNLSGTLVSDISPLRNLASLEKINLSNTNLASVPQLDFLQALQELDISGTAVSNLKFVKQFPSLRKLRADYTSVKRLEGIESAQNLQFLTLSRNRIHDISPIGELAELKALDLGETDVEDIAPLGNCKELENLNIEKTRVNNLSGLQNLQKLRYIFSDGAQLSATHVKEFQRTHPECLIIFETQILRSWWESLAPQWKEVFGKHVHFSDSITREELHQIAAIEEIDLSGTTFNNISPLKYLASLRVINMENVPVNDLSLLQNFSGLERLNLKGTKIENLNGLENVPALRDLNIEQTQISSLEPLSALKNPVKILMDGTLVPEEQAFLFHSARPNWTIIYKSEKLLEWWNSLSESLKNYFSEKLELSGAPDTELLHRIADSEIIDINEDKNIRSLNELTILKRLKILRLPGSSISEIQNIKNFSDLEELNLSFTPIVDFMPLSTLSKLRKLELSGTRFLSAEPIKNMSNLEYLNISSSPISKLPPFPETAPIHYLDVSNTKVSNLAFLKNKPSQLKTLKCFNTKISKKNIAKFRAENPDCEVIFY